MTHFSSTLHNGRPAIVMCAIGKDKEALEKKKELDVQLPLMRVNGASPIGFLAGLVGWRMWNIK
jgi:hypothetical protein